MQVIQYFGQLFWFDSIRSLLIISPFCQNTNSKALEHKQEHAMLDCIGEA